jgi:hypothetical protein
MPHPLPQLGQVRVLRDGGGGSMRKHILATVQPDRLATYRHFTSHPVEGGQVHLGVKSLRGGRDLGREQRPGSRLGGSGGRVAPLRTPALRTGLGIPVPFVVDLNGGGVWGSTSANHYP